MKDFRPALRSILLGDPTVSSLVGGSRIFPTLIPQSEKNPSLVYHRISEGADYHMGGSSGTMTARVQLDAIAVRSDIATQLANAAFDRLSGFKGTQDQVEFQGIFLISAREDYDNLSQLFRMSRDYNVWYNA